MIYLDNNATTAVAPEVLEAMVPWLRDEYGNPSSVYESGRRANAAIESARASVAGLIGASPEEIIFTSCGTESINTAILSCASMDPDRRHVVTSAVEHSATIKLCEHLARRGYEITWLPVRADGTLDPDLVAESITDETAVVSLLLANNETGVLFPVEEIGRIATERKVPFHIDAVQAAGKVPVDVRACGAHFLSLSGHKLHCPKGVGALWVRNGLRYEPLLRGSQENGRRGGTQNVASIVAFGAAAALAAERLEECGARVRAMRDLFESRVLSEVPGTTLNGHSAQRLPNTSNLSFEGIRSEEALLLLGERGICVSAGSACSSGSVHPSHVLRAMGVPNELAGASLRFSFGRMNSDSEAVAAAEAVREVVGRLRERGPRTVR